MEVLRLSIKDARLVEKQSDGTLEIELLHVTPIRIPPEFSEALHKDLTEQGVTHKNADRLVDTAMDAIHEESVIQVLRDRTS